MQPDNKLSTELRPENKDIISFFNNDTDFILAHKKTEKLSSAIYMITNLFSENEPMRWTLRKKVGDLMSFSISYKDIKEGGIEDFTNDAKTKVLEIVSLLEISARGGLISAMNLSILKQEFLNLINIFEASNIATKQAVNNSVSKIFGATVVSQGTINIKPVQNVAAQSSSTISRVSDTDIKDRNVSSPVRENENKTNRQAIILNLIKRRKELTIKDISEVIKDCSEKTIQRELNAFITKGILKRRGVRRWSKYSLV